MKQEDFMDIIRYDGIGYQPVHAWRNIRLAYLNYHPELLPENIGNFQKHEMTDESFILLEGHCALFLASDETLEDITIVDMEPGRIYNIKQDSYHTHTLSEDARVLIVEADDTSDDLNSPSVKVTEPVRAKILELMKEITWK